MKFLNKRVCAFLLDYLFVRSLVLLFGLLPGAFTGLILNYLSYIGYFLVRDALFKGRSIGKLLVGLSVVNSAGNKCNLQESVLRNVIFVIPAVSPVVEYIAMSASKEGRRLGDLLAKTTVQDDRPRIGDGWFLLFSILLVIFLTAISLAFLFQSAANLKAA